MVSKVATFEVQFAGGRVEEFPLSCLTSVLYGNTKLEQTPLLPHLGVELIREKDGRVLWPAAAIHQQHGSGG